jgi:hypothetical protein
MPLLGSGGTLIHDGRLAEDEPEKTILFSGVNNPYQKISETRKLQSIHE